MIVWYGKLFRWITILDWFTYLIYKFSRNVHCPKRPCPKWQWPKRPRPKYPQPKRPLAETSADQLIRPVVSVSTLTWFIRNTVESRYVKVGLLEISVKSSFKLSAFQLNFLLLSPLISKFDVSKFRVSRSSFSVPNIKIHSNYVRYVNQFTILSRCQYHGLRCLPRQVLFFLVTVNYHL